MTPLEDCFRRLDQPSKEVLADLPGPLQKALGVLLIAEDEFQRSWLSAAEISEALRSTGVSLRPQQIGPALRRAGGKVSTRRKDGVNQYGIMIPGRREVEAALARSALTVVYVEAGKPRTARHQLAHLLEPLSGDVRVSDPYYGVRTLDSLSLMKSATSVRFLTAKTNEKAADVSRAIQDFRKEHPTTEIRRAADPSLMHDRYVVSSDTLILIGHGLKDIGGKESFVIRLDGHVAEDLIATLVAAFDAKWSSASVI